MTASYEILYYRAAGAADLPRMILELAKADYKNVFVDSTNVYATSWIAL